MTARSRLLAGAAATGLALSALAVPAAMALGAQATGSVRISVTGIDRTGHKVGVYAVVYTLTDAPILLTPGRSAVVPKGPAWIGAEVDTVTGTPPTLINATLVVRKVTISRRGSITLDARPGKRVTFGAPVAGAGVQSEQIQACIGGNFVPGFPVGAGISGGAALYAVPVKSSGFFFGYGATWQNSAATYDYAGQSYGGVPSRLHYQARLSQMAKVQFAFRTNTAIDGYANLQLQTQNTCQISDGNGIAAPQAFTDYVSAGSWQAEAYGYRAFWQDTVRYKAGHSYVNSFGNAAWGPGQDFPNIQINNLDYFPESPISDPNQTTFVCCDHSNITVSSGGHVLKHAVLSQWRAERDLSVPLRPGNAWYTMQVIGTRWVPGVPVPANILSPRDSIVWHFRARRQPEVSNPLFVPVTATHFLPHGLNLLNQASPGGLTTLQVWVVRPTAAGFDSLRYRLKTVQVQMSINDGKTWQSVRLTKHGNFWLASLRDPSAGYVSLRSTVKDVAGDSTVETIYRAYSVS